ALPSWSALRCCKLVGTMRWLKRLGGTLLVLLAPAPAVSQNGPDAGPDAGASPLPACIAVTTEARYGAVGYDHIVSLHNGCDRKAACVVTTDVNPIAITVELAPGAREDVVTFRGSPARVFTAKVSCQLEASAARRRG